MTLSCTTLHGIVVALPLVQSCDVVANGALRMATPFLYPNGSHIDIFLENKPNLYAAYRLSDYGQTGLYLSDLQIRINASERRKQIVRDICSELQVELKDGCLEIPLSEAEMVNISPGLLRLGQACMRVASFAYHHSLRSTNPFKESVEEFLETSQLKFQPDVKVMSAYAKPVKVDFEIHGSKDSYLLSIPATSEQSAHQASTEIFRKWHDIKKTKESHQFVTIYNSASSKLILPEDITRLKDYSEVIAYPSQSSQLLTAVS